MTRRAPKRTLLGNRLPVKLKYHSSITLNTDISGLAVGHVYSANGLFDPDISGAGHQPRGFDQLMTLYQFYTVVGAKCTATFYPVGPEPDNLATRGGTCSVALLEGSTLLQGQIDILEDRNVSFGGLGYFEAGPVPLRIIKTFSAKQFLGLKNPLDNYDNRGTTLANPLEQAFFHVSYIPVEVGVAAGQVRVQVDIEYSAVLTESKLPLIS